MEPVPAPMPCQVYDDDFSDIELETTNPQTEELDAQATLNLFENQPE